MTAVTTRTEPVATERIWWVKCEEYAVGPYTKAAAQAKLEAIEAAGHCYGEHKVVARPGGLGRRW